MGEVKRRKVDLPRASWDASPEPPLSSSPLALNSTSRWLEILGDPRLIVQWLNGCWSMHDGFYAPFVAAAQTRLEK
eukprot:8550347-Pyramimonas_sp.AAC.1